MPDIDIDFADRNQVLGRLKHRVAKLDNGKKHNTGIYVTEIPHNPVNALSTIDYKTAEDRGYFKLDFLNVSLYKDIKSEVELNKLLEKEPLWDLLTAPEFTTKLFHVGEHSSLLKKLKPNESALRTCPLCTKDFHWTLIDAHASECVGIEDTKEKEKKEEEKNCLLYTSDAADE